MLRRFSLALGCLALSAAFAAGQGHRTFLANSKTGSPVLTAAVLSPGAACEATQLHFLVNSGEVAEVSVCRSAPGREGPRHRGKGFRRRGLTCFEIQPFDVRLQDRSGTVAPALVVPMRGGSSQGAVEPVEGPDGLLWLCKEDEAGQECTCIPWAQD